MESFESRNITFSPLLNGTIQLTGSKSITNRARVIAYLAGGNCRLLNMAKCADADALENALEGGETADIGAAGTAMRFLTALFTLEKGGSRLLTGTERMKQRPIGILVDALRGIGGRIDYVGNDGYPPLRIYGQKPLGGSVSLPANVSSQYISALLLIAPMLENGLHLRLEGEIASLPYINMTLALMRRFGAKAEWADEQTIDVEAHPYIALDSFTVEPDWSGASYWYEMVALSPDEKARIELPGLSAESVQGDAKIAEYFKALGVHTTYNEKGIVLTKAEAGNGAVEMDLSNEPDMAQTLVTTCTVLERPFRISGLKSLRIKETDRIAALSNELGKLGYVVDVQGDDLIQWNGIQRCQPHYEAGIDTYEDHRMAMSFAPCAYRFPGLCINHPEVVKKSYPDFWKDIDRFTV